MALMIFPVNVYLEIGRSRTFAAALDWPGLSRTGRDESAVLQALVDYAPRYARILDGSGLGFEAPSSTSNLAVIERVPGNATTDYGVPVVVLPSDEFPVEAAELNRWKNILGAEWKAFDRIARAALGKELRKGPRGGGRDLEQIIAHVRDAEISYLDSLGAKFQINPAGNPDWTVLRQTIFASLDMAVRGEMPLVGPRGGKRWPARYFIRRLACHLLDHIWEIEDRVE
ncbi:MAG: hypothetical protein AB9891_06350 [Anaerolineaceae bacterium]